MKGDQILMSQKQSQRYRVMNLVEAGKITLKEGAEKFGRSYRQAKRIWKRVKEKGGQGLLHGNCGRSPQNRLPDRVKKRIAELSGQTYSAFNDRHFWEQLLEQEGIVIGWETVRKIRREAGILPKRKRRASRHRKRRERRAQEGWMVLWDGSPHQWFGPHHPPCCLMAALDDATVRLGGLLLDIPPGSHGRSYAKAQVEVRQLLNGSWKVYYQDHLIAKHPSTALREPIRALPRNRSNARGAKSYDWIYQASASPNL